MMGYEVKCLTMAAIVIVVCNVSNSRHRDQILVGRQSQSHNYSSLLKPADGERHLAARATPATDDVENLVNTCFDGLLVTDKSLLPSFIEGDFDGDKKTDLFVPVRLGKNVDRHSRVRPAFNYQEVLASGAPARVALDLRLGNLGIVETWPLFVVISDVSRVRNQGCSQSKNKFLLQFVMDKGTSTLRLFTGKRLPSGTIGDVKEDQPPPSLKGDAVLLLDGKNNGSAIYWDGNRYRWYPYN